MERENPVYGLKDMRVFPNCPVNTVPSWPFLFLKEIDKMNVKLIWKCRRHRIAKITFKRIKLKYSILSDFKTSYEQEPYCEAVVVDSVCVKIG